MPIKVIQWDLDAWEDYLYWQSQDKKNLKKINKLLKDISRNPFEGIGKPEPLKENLTGFWSRRIDEEHRLVYAVEDERVTFCVQHNSVHCLHSAPLLFMFLILLCISLYFVLCKIAIGLK